MSKNCVICGKFFTIKRPNGSRNITCGRTHCKEESRRRYFQREEVKRSQQANREKWERKNPDKKKESSRNYMRRERAKDPEKYNARWRHWRAVNPEVARQSTARWKSKNKDRVDAKTREWRAANPEKVKAMDRAKYLRKTISRALAKATVAINQGI